jgi:dolichol-phosphate mannosyltransferase
MDVKQFIKFGLVGGSGVIVNTVVLYGLTDFVGIYYLASSLIATELSILNNFVWNDLWTFKENRAVSRLRRICTYHIISVGGAVINISILYGLTQLGVYYLLSNGVGIVVAFGWNFLMNKKVTWTTNAQNR